MRNDWPPGGLPRTHICMSRRPDVIPIAIAGSAPMSPHACEHLNFFLSLPHDLIYFRLLAGRVKRSPFVFRRAGGILAGNEEKSKILYVTAPVFSLTRAVYKE